MEGASLEDNHIKDILKRIDRIENLLQNNDYIKQDEFNNISNQLQELARQVTNVDKEYAVDKVRNANTLELVNTLSTNLDVLRQEIKDNDVGKKERLDKYVVPIVSSVLAFVLGKFL